MIDHILNAPVITNPWTHIVVDNFFALDDWDKISNGAKILAPKMNDGQKVIDYRCAEQELNLSSEIAQIFEKYASAISNSQIEILTKLKNFDPNETYYVHGQWASFMNRWYKIHCDKLNKAMTCIVYVRPETAYGTVLYTGNKQDDFHSIVEWKPNRGVLFPPIDNVSWHSFFHYGNEPRITAGFYLLKESMKAENEYS